ncbi:MAG: zinc ribbon domain-containing protein [Gammaproteobacteria bacterium]|nr:zinc ribbon domain-containing protein [Gammaproteobacteria bacterium]
MAIINCPVCNKRISSVATQCEFCKTDFADGIDDEKLLRKAKNKRFIQIQRLQNFSFLFVMLFATGALVMYLGITDQDETLNLSGRVMLAAGFIGYVIARVKLLMAKKK